MPKLFLAEEPCRHIIELLFFASVGDVARMRDLCQRHNIDVSDENTCDYDRRTPLHLAAAEGQFNAVEWLVTRKHCNPSPVDRFGRTPLECAFIGKYLDIQKLLFSAGAKVYRKGIGLVECQISSSVPDRYRNARGTGSDSSAYTASEGKGFILEVPSTVSSEDCVTLTQVATSLSSNDLYLGKLEAREGQLRLLPHLLEARANGLGGLELGCLIGLGSYGKVYKGMWRGGKVAVKVLTHEGSRARKLNALHESMVSAAVHHPNVVMTYQVHTVQQPQVHPCADEATIMAAYIFNSTGVAGRGSRASSSAHSGKTARNPSAALSAAEAAATRAFAAAATSGFCPAEGTLPARAAHDEREAADEENVALCENLRMGSLTTEVSSTTCAPRLPPAPLLPQRPGVRLASAARSADAAADGAGSGSSPDSSEQVADSETDGRFLGTRLSCPLPAKLPEEELAPLTPENSSRVPQQRSQSSSVPSTSGRSSLSSSPIVETLLIMEYADLGTLNERNQEGWLRGDLMKILMCLFDVAAGMNYLHSIGIIHSDLKAANVLLKSSAVTQDDPRGFMCKVADFGLSRVLEDNMTHVSTQSYGTVAYMSPQVLQLGCMSKAADVYSFALLMLEVWIGDVIYRGIMFHQVLFKVFSGEKPPVPADMPPDYRALMERCWAFEPDQRPSFKEVKTELRRMLAKAQSVA